MIRGVTGRAAFSFERKPQCWGPPKKRHTHIEHCRQEGFDAVFSEAELESPPPPPPPPPRFPEGCLVSGHWQYLDSNLSQAWDFKK